MLTPILYRARCLLRHADQEKSQEDLKHGGVCDFDMALGSTLYYNDTRGIGIGQYKDSATKERRTWLRERGSMTKP